MVVLIDQYGGFIIRGLEDSKNRKLNGKTGAIIARVNKPRGNNYSNKANNKLSKCKFPGSIKYGD